LLENLAQTSVLEMYDDARAGAYRDRRSRGPTEGHRPEYSEVYGDGGVMWAIAGPIWVIVDGGDELSVFRF
jgi:hypothetical protein